MKLAFAFVLVGVARAAGLPAGVTAAQLAPCNAGPLDKLTIEPVGKSGAATVLHAVAPGGDRALLFLHPDGENAATSAGRRCERFPIGRALDRAHGRFLVGGGELKAYAIAPAGDACTGDYCPLVVVLRGADERPLAALRTRETCDAGATLHAVKLFPDRDSLEVACRTASGAGWSERRFLVDAAIARGEWIALFAVDTGSHQSLSPDEKAAGQCAPDPVGWIKVERIDARPVLRALDPTNADLTDGRGTVPARAFVFDPAKRAFVPSPAPPVPTQVDAFAACRSKR